ncbi:MAG: hypothetical protein HY042_01930 [Spirochaetia bacterium]|nr:hypothetical protein [Spirochaetia bacterium]
MERIMHWWRTNPPLAWSVVYNAILLATLLPLAFMDERLVTGQPVWIKPMKFAVSISLYSATLLWLLQFLQQRRRARIVSWIIALMGLIEMVCIVGQAGRGVQSHFNIDSAFNGAVFSLMGASITILWIAHVVTAVTLLRDRTFRGPVQAAVKGGMIVAAVGMAVAFFMTVPGFNGPIQLSPSGQPYATGHSIGAPQDGPGLVLFGWSLTGGDLRISHFVGLHAMQLIPLFALLAMHIRLSEVGQTIIVRAFTWSYGIVVLVLLVQALRGIPFYRIDPATAAGYACAGVVLFWGLVSARVESRRRPSAAV